MPSVQPSELLVYVGGECWPIYGPSYRRTQLPARGGEDIGLAFSRASVASYVTRDGGLRQAASGVLRASWSDLDGDGAMDALGCRIEDGRSNSWTYSEDLTQAVYTPANATINPNTTLAPDGQPTADSLVESAATAIHQVSRNAPALTDNTLQAVSFYGKKVSAGREWVSVLTTNKAGASYASWINVSTGQLGTVDSHHQIVLRYGTGWYRVLLTFDSASGATTPAVAVRMATGDGVTSYAGNGASDVALWGFQFDTDKAFASTYMKTGAATVTRSQDVLTVPAYFGIAAGDLTLYAAVRRPVYADLVGNFGIFPGLCGLGNGTAPDLRLFFQDSSRNLQASLRDGSTTVNVATAIPAGAKIEACVQATALKTAGKIRLDVGSGFGAYSATVGPITAWGLPILRVGALPDALFGHLLSLKIARGLFTLAEMRAARP